MILFELTEKESHPVYQELEISNGIRQYDFLRDIIAAAVKIDRPMLSHQIIKALNYHAIACLHTNPGEYRPCDVKVGSHRPPPDFRVQALMDDFVDQVNRYWDEPDLAYQAAWILWRLNYIHPFINGNGRTARAIAYFVLCVRAEGPLPGEKILPALIKEHRAEYVAALRVADMSIGSSPVDQSFNKKSVQLEDLKDLIDQLLEEQIGVE
ncbi:Fic family protein [Gluconobacter cerinus]|uniref:Fic family protein n=1 Tax=Gluconobacter cerinus TaxID=38307 RepID=UPI001B8BD9C8|nr:Fic family protein [Gluconobacter cerinus]